MGYRIPTRRRRTGLSRSHSLRGRLLGAMLAVFGLGFAVAFVSYRFEVHHIVSDLHARTLQAQARELVTALHLRTDGSLGISLPADWRRVYGAPSTQFAYTVFDATHHPVAWSPNLDTPLAYIPAGASKLGPIEFVGVGSAQMAVLAAKGPSGYSVVVARHGFAGDALADSLLEEDSEQLFILVPFALLALGLIWMISGWSLRPLARASREAALVGPGKPELRISPQGLPREIQPLVKAVNGALDRLSRAYSTERRLTADAAHELRTPLAVLNLRLQRARLSEITDWPAIEQELGQMGRLVDQLMDLARKESLSNLGRTADMPVINLSRVVREAAAMVVPLMEAQNRRLDVDMPDVLPLRGRANDLRDMVRNLLDNALLHGKGAVTIRIRPLTPPSQLKLAVEVCDEGDGVPPGQEELVFERFRKLQAESPGSGLGLAIVRQVARSHGGDVRLVPGRGCIILSLPATAPAAAAIDSP